MLSDVQGQPEGIALLQRFVEGKLTSPLLILGQPGTGRKMSVFQATKELFCEGSHNNNCSCIHCLYLKDGIHPDFRLIQPEDKKDIGIDTIREVIDYVGNYPSISSLRVVLIDGADHMTLPAANSFLKILEEPPTKIRFFLLAETESRVLPTIRSRCGRVIYKPLSDNMVLSMLQKFEPDPTKALVYSRMSEGSVGKAIQYWGSGRLALRDRIFTLLSLAMSKDLSSMFTIVDEVSQDPALTLKVLEQIVCDLIMISTGRVINVDISDKIQKVSQKTSLGIWVNLIDGVKLLSERVSATKISFAFHLKALLVDFQNGI